MIEFDAEILSVIQRTEKSKSFRVKTAHDIEFFPGQYLAVTVDAGGGKITKPLSFSSSPTEKGYIEFTKKITESVFSATLNKMKPGCRVHLRLPFGKFTFSGEYPKIALLSGGIGITPFRSICKNATDKGLASDIVLVYGNRTEADIIFKEDLDAMSGLNNNLEVVYVLSSVPDGENKNGFIKGHIDESLIKARIPDYPERVFYVCGPPAMVESLVAMLSNKLNIPQANIRIEHFMGY